MLFAAGLVWFGIVDCVGLVVCMFVLRIGCCLALYLWLFCLELALGGCGSCG